MGTGGFQFDPSRWPTLGAAPAANRDVVGPGISSGVDEFQGMLGSAAEGAGRLAGMPGLEAFGRDVAQRNTLESAANGRPDLEITPWKQGGASVLPWLAYQTAKQVPLVASLALAGRVTPQALVSEDLARAGASVPRVLGGGGLKAGADFAARREALGVGKEFARNVTGAEIAGLPVAYGSMIQEADNKPGGMTDDDAQRALLMSPAYAALDALQPATLKGVFKRGLEGNLLKRVATAGLVDAAAEVPQEGLQTAMEQSFRPDLTPQQKMSNIVDAAITGGAVGGVMGGVSGIRKMKSMDASTVQTEDLGGVIDEVLQRALPSPEAAAGGQLAPNAVVAGDKVSVPTMDFVTGERTDIQSFKVGQLSRPRPYENTSPEELQAGLGAARRAIDSGTASDEVKQFVEEAHRELATRVKLSETSNGAETVVGAALSEPVPGVSGVGSATAHTAPTTAQAPDFQARMAELKKGARNQWVKKLEAVDEGDLVAKVHAQIYENQDDREGTKMLARRLGLLDEQDNETPLAAQISASKAEAAQAASLATEPAAPANQEGGDPTAVAAFKPAFTKLLEGKRWDASVRSLNPTSQEDLERKVYHALGAQEVSPRMETLAQDLGLLDEHKQMTDKAAQIAYETPIPTEKAVGAALEQGYKGQAASMFDRGAQDVVKGAPTPKLSSFEELKAYQAGQAWAQDRNFPTVATKAVTQEFVDKHTAYIDRKGKAVQNIVGTVQVDPEAAARAEQHAAIDAQFNSTHSPGELAQLKLMINKGATPAEIDQAAAAFAAGETPLANAPPARKEFTGERPDALTSVAQRAQRTMIEQDRAIAQSRGRDEEVKSADAIKKHLLKGEINAAMASGDLSRTEGIRLTHMLSKNDFSGVVVRLPGGKLNPGKFEARNLVGAMDNYVADNPEFRDQLVAAGDQPEKALAWISKIGGADPFERVLAGAILTTMGRMKAVGYKFELKHAVKGDAEENVHAWAQFSDRKTAQIWMRTGADNTELPTPALFLHEALHSVMGMALEYGENHPNTPMGKLATELQGITDELQERFNQRTPRDSDLNSMEKDIYGGSNAIDNMHEVAAWALTNDRMQEHLESIKPAGKTTLLQRFVDAIRKFLGLATKDTSYLERIVLVSSQVMHGADTVSPEMNRQASFAARAAQVAKAPPVAVSDALREKIAPIIQAVDKLPVESMAAGARKTALGWMSQHHITQTFSKWFDRANADGVTENGLQLLEHTADVRKTIVARLSQLLTNSRDAINRLQRDDAPAAENIRWLMTLSEKGLHPARKWEEQSEAVRNSPHAAILKADLVKANNVYRSLTTKRHIHIYNDLRDINDVEMFATTATSLYQEASMDALIAASGLAQFQEDPIDQFLAASVDKDVTPAVARSFWSGILTKQVQAIKEFARAQRAGADASTDDKLKAKVAAHARPLEDRVTNIEAMIKNIDEAPYFHLGRFGQYFVAFHARLMPDSKEVDQTAVDKIAAHLASRGFSGIQISQGTERSNMYIRVENPDAMESLSTAVDELGEAGLLDPEKTSARGKVSDEKNSAIFTDKGLTRITEIVKSNDMLDDKAKAQLTDALRKARLELLPETSVSRVMTNRDAVPGYAADMFRSFDHRSRVFINGLAGLATAPRTSQAFVQMRSALRDAQHAPQGAVSTQQNVGMQQVVDEMSVRDNQSSDVIDTPILDRLKGLSTANFLGGSVSYVAVQFTQLGATLWPELSKTHGFVRSAKAISDVTPLALRIMREVFEEGKKVSLSRATDAVVTRTVLNRVPGMSKKTAEFIMMVVNTAQIDIGGPARELVRGAEGRADNNVDTALRYASAMGYYSETATRLIAALASHKLDDKIGQDEAVARAALVIKESMWDYSQGNQGRMFGKRGLLGAVTPLSTQFMQYTAQLIEKLGREFYTGVLSKEASEQEKQQARRFIGAHLSAMTVLAGTLGLPAATMFAMAFDKLKDLLGDDDEPSNIRASYRNFLADVFGADIGEVLARGASRAAGVDISQRVGEQDIIPFSKFLNDRRQFKDKWKDLATQSYGAPSSMVAGWVEGSGKLMDGDVLGGLTKMLPNAMAAPVKAYQMTEKGYVDGNGNALPIKSPGAYEVLAQAVGFNPAAKAEDAEQRGDVRARKGVLTREATVIRKQLVDAVVEGDRDRQRDLVDQAQRFDQAHPTFAVLPTIESAVRRRARLQAISQATQSPVGVGADDIQGQRLARYGNVEYRAQ